MKRKPITENLSERKNQLLKEIKAIVKQEEEQTIAEHHPKISKQFVGKFFKNENYYGGDTKKWWVYSMVTEIKPSDVYDTVGNGVTAHFHGWSFQTTPNGLITVDTEIDYGYIHSLGQQITKKEFYTAWNKMISKIGKLP